MHNDNFSPTDPALSWVVANTHTHREALAIEHLNRQQYQAYCPRIVRRIRHARQIRDVLRPLFPGYIFVAIDLRQTQWRPMLSTVGIRSLVRCGAQLSFIRDEFVLGMRSREVDGVIVRPKAPFQVGQKVRPTGGPFDSIIATIISLDEKDRLVVLMDLLNGKIKARIDADRVSTL